MATGLAVVVSADAGNPTSRIVVVEDDGSIRQLTGSGRTSSVGAELPAWSPDGSQLAFGPPKIGAGAARFVSLVDSEGAGERPLAELGDEFILPVAWSPDGTRVVYSDIDAADGPAMWLVDVARGEVGYLGVGLGPRWLPDGRRISFVRGVEGRDPDHPGALSQVIFLLDLDSGQVVEFAEASDAVWAPGGSSVLLQLETGELVLTDAAGSARRDLARGWDPVWSPDGGRIAFGYDHDTDGVPLLAVVDRVGRPIWSGVSGSSPSWSPDGSRLAVEVSYPQPTVRVVDARTGEVLWQVAGAQPAWSPR